MIIINNKYIILLLILFIASCSKHEPVGIKMDNFSDFKLVKYEKNKLTDVYTYKNGDKNIIIEKMPGIDIDSAKKLINSDITDIKLIYSDGLSPYPGELSNKIVISQNLKPVFKELIKNEILYYFTSVYTNDRLTLGVPSLEMATRNLLVGWIYCNNTYYKIRISFPFNRSYNEIENLFLSIKCA